MSDPLSKPGALDGDILSLRALNYRRSIVLTAVLMGLVYAIPGIGQADIEFAGLTLPRRFVWPGLGVALAYFVVMFGLLAWRDFAQWSRLCLHNIGPSTSSTELGFPRFWMHLGWCTVPIPHGFEGPWRFEVTTTGEGYATWWCQRIKPAQNQSNRSQFRILKWQLHQFRRRFAVFWLLDVPTIPAVAIALIAFGVDHWLDQPAEVAFVIT